MGDQRRNTCCFTGHRAAKLPWGHNEADERCAALKERLSRVIAALYARGVRRFICGMALGSDTYFAEAVLALRETHPDVRLEAAIPCPEQADMWRSEAYERRERIISQCDSVKVLSHSYSPGCMEKRNRYMVDESGVLVAVFNGSPGGTFNTIRYASQEGLDIIELGT